MPSPSGNRIDDGFPTFITFSLNTTAALWEVNVKPPGLDGGGPNDTTTMRNITYRTKAPKKLVTLTPCSGTCGYDPAFYTQLLSMLNKNQQITITFPDGSTLVFWGFLDKLEPQDLTEGAPPRANFTIEPSNQNNSGAETAPTRTSATTTTSTTTTTTT